MVTKDGEIAIMCPQPGKNSWTWKELLKSTINDTPLENFGKDRNMIDDIIEYYEYITKNGKGKIHRSL